MNLKFTFSVFVLAFSILLFCAIPTRADRVDDFVRAQMRERHIPGAAIVVNKAGRTVKIAGYGLANIELNVLATKDTVFEIGSISKQITAAAVMLLVEEGKINLDDKISKYLSNAPEAWSKVTIRNLLTHTSGIKNYTGLPGFELSKRLKPADFIKAAGVLPLEFEPGERYNYSNTGYNLLGHIVEAASGKSYWDFLRERIFAPLGMSATANRDPQFIVKNRADGYEWENDRYVGRDGSLTDLFSAGAIVSTVADLAKWDMALRSTRFLKQSSKERIWTPFVLSNGKTNPYGFGWSIGELRGRKLVSHGGHTAGFSSNISRYTDDDLSVIVLSNLGTVGNGAQIARGVAKIYLPELSLRRMKELPGADAETTRRMQNALVSYLNEKLEADFFSERSRAALSTQTAKQTARRLRNFGTAGKMVLVGDEKSSENRIYRYRVGTPARLMLWRFAVDKDGRIAEMILEEEE